MTLSFHLSDYFRVCVCVRARVGVCAKTGLAAFFEIETQARTTSNQSAMASKTLIF